MARIKEGLKDIKTPKLLEKSLHIIAQITDNPHFPGAQQKLPALEAATTELLEAVLAAQRKDRYNILLKNEKHKQVKQLLQSVAVEVQHESLGNAIIIQSSGFSVRKKKEPIGILRAPENVRTVLTKQPGTVILRWKGVHGSKSYVIEQNNNDPLVESQWHIVQSVTRTIAIITGLTSGEKYWCRVRALGASGTGATSKAVIGMAW